MYRKAKKYILLFSLIIFSFSIQSCGIINSKKPNKYYYTNLLAKAMVEEKGCSIKIFDTNFYQQRIFSKDNINTVKSFLNALKPNNFINKPKDLPVKPEYKIFLTFENDKYVINVMSAKYITIYPWDGDYDMDYIDMTGIYKSYNIYDLSKFLYTVAEK